MASPRVPLFYSNLFRAIRACEPTTYRSIRAPPCPPPSRKRPLHTTANCLQQTYQQRYGPAASASLPPPPKPSEPLSPKKDTDSKDKEPSKGAKSDLKGEIKQPEEDGDTTTTSSPQSKPDTSDVNKQGDNQKTKAEDESKPNKELDMVLSVPSPSEVKKDSHKHPHLEPSRYEHHFDTYSLVQQLAGEGCFTEEQAVTLMKAIRLMLAANLDIAREGLVSKSDVENETYLFRAACSELRTTLQAGRHSEMQRQRSSRAQLQHEFDILNQKVTQDLTAMREELKGMFNDRKLSLQEEKRKIDGKIQEINYEITVLLNSDSKSEVEGLRWVLTRRAALAIAISACKFLFS